MSITCDLTQFTCYNVYSILSTTENSHITTMFYRRQLPCRFAFPCRFLPFSCRLLPFPCRFLPFPYRLLPFLFPCRLLPFPCHLLPFFPADFCHFPVVCLLPCNIYKIQKQNNPISWGMEKISQEKDKSRQEKDNNKTRKRTKKTLTRKWQISTGKRQ